MSVYGFVVVLHLFRSSVLSVRLFFSFFFYFRRSFSFWDRTTFPLFFPFLFFFFFVCPLSSLRICCPSSCIHKKKSIDAPMKDNRWNRCRRRHWSISPRPLGPAPSAPPPPHHPSRPDRPLLKYRYIRRHYHERLRWLDTHWQPVRPWPRPPCLLLLLHRNTCGAGLSRQKTNQQNKANERIRLSMWLFYCFCVSPPSLVRRAYLVGAELNSNKKKTKQNKPVHDIVGNPSVLFRRPLAWKWRPLIG